MNIVGPLSSDLVESCLDAASDQNSSVKVCGTIVAVYVQPVIDCLSSPTVTITTKGSPVETVLAEANFQAAAWRYPKTIAHLNTTGAAIANVYSEGVPVYDYINVAISDANYGDYVNVWLLVE